MSADRNLLLGILALQLDFITRDQLIAGMNTWVLNKQNMLVDILAAQGALREDSRALLLALVAKHLELHGNCAVKSLASLSSIGSVREELQGIADSEVSGTLSHVARKSESTDATLDLSGSADTNEAPRQARSTTDSLLRFKILRPHAKGGLGEVFVAKDNELNREVALKEIQPRFADDMGSRSRFRLEAEVTGNLEHPGIVPVYGLGQYADGRPFYAMRFIRGDSLKEAIEQFHSRFGTSSGQRMTDGEASLELRKLLRRFVDVCNAIEYAHSRGVLHRDVKPGNVVLGKYGETLVVDWGLAKALGKTEQIDASLAPVTPSTESGSAPTMLGSAIGTPAYMSPEQAGGRVNELGPATDVYSLGATLYHLLTGKTPVQGMNLAETLQRVQSGEYSAPCQVRADVPRPLEAICLRAMALKAENRYDSPLALADELERWLADEPVNAHRETIVAKGSRWVRKHRAWAVSGAAALALVSIVATVAAFWIAEKERAATELAKSNALLASDKSGLAEEMSKLADQETTAREKAELATLAEKQAKEEEAIQRKLALEAAEAQKRERLRAEDASSRALAAQRRAEVAALSEKQAKEEEARQRARAIAAAENEKRLRLVANQETKRANDEVDRGRRQLYATRMTLVELAWEGARAGEAQRLLDLYRPRAEQEVSEDLRGFEWFYWDRLCRSELLTFKMHNAPVTNVAFRADGKRIASASYDQTVKVWDTTSGQVMLTLKGHSGMVWCVAFSPDGKRLASGAWDRTIKIWDAINGQEMLTLRGPSEILGVAFSPDGRQLASAGNDRTVKLWDTASGKETLTITRHAEPVLSVSFSFDGKQIVSTSTDRTLKVCDATSGRETLTLRGHTGPVVSAAFSPDGKVLASAGGYGDGVVKLWDAANGREIRTMKGHTTGATSVAFCADGKRLASSGGYGDNTIKVWDADSGQETLTLKRGLVDSGVMYGNVAFSADGKRLAAASLGGTVTMWDATSSLDPVVLKGHAQPVWSVAFSPDGTLLASAGGLLEMPGTVKIWSATTGCEVMTLTSHDDVVNSVAFSPNGKFLATASGSRNVQNKLGKVKIINVSTGQVVHTLNGHAGPVTCVAFSHSGKRLASASDDQTAKLWDVTLGQELFTLRGHTHLVSSVAFAPDERLVVSSSLDGTVKVWDVESGRESLTIKGHTAQVLNVTFDGDGKRLASASADKTVRVWDSTNGQEVLTLNGHTGPVTCVAFASGGKRLVSSSADRTLKFWDVTTGQETLTITGHNASVSSVAFSRDGSRLASASQDQTVRLWDARPWTPELRAEREALSLLHFLRDRGIARAKWLDVIMADETISEPVRQRALKFAREWK